MDCGILEGRSQPNRYDNLKTSSLQGGLRLFMKENYKKSFGPGMKI
jgi:hypothetical protein